MINLNKDQWLNDMPKLIYNLRLNYGFWFGCFYSNIKKDILEVVANPKNKHKICVYNKNKRFFLVIYKKNGPDIFYCSEYRNDTSSSRIRYFMRKFCRAYEKAEEDYGQKVYSGEMDNPRRIQQTDDAN